MRDVKTFLFVNPWIGWYGPNTGMHQLGCGALARGHKVVIAVQELSEPLRQLREMGADIRVVPGLEMTRRTSNPWTLATHLLRSWRAAKTVGKLCRQTGANLVCVNCENMIFMPRSGPLAGQKTVCIIRGSRFAKPAVIGRVFFGIQKRWVWKYVAISNATRDMIMSVGVDESQVQVICNGVNTAVFTPAGPRVDLRSEFGIPSDALVLGDVALIEPLKGIHHVVEAMPRICRRVPNAWFLVVGDYGRHGEPAYYARLKARAKELGVGDRVRFAGARTDMPDLLRAMDVMVHPSHSESFGRVIAEAMATGLPVVGFRVGAVGEVIDHERTGLVVQPHDEAALGDAVVRLLTDRALREQMGLAGREKVQQHYELSRNLGATLDLIERAAGSGSAVETAAR